MTKLTAEATLQIQKPVNEVFEGIADPEQMTKYFISESSGRMETGKELIWKFPEFSEQFLIHHIKIEVNRSFSFIWDEGTVVNISLEAQPDQSTIVKITEGDKAFHEDNLKWLIENTGGWANFLDCLKAFLEYGIQLRRGAYDFMRKNSQQLSQ